MKNKVLLLSLCYKGFLPRLFEEFLFPKVKEHANPFAHGLESYVYSAGTAVLNVPIPSSVSVYLSLYTDTEGDNCLVLN